MFPPAAHASATSAGATDWRQIVALYNLLAQAAPSPVVEPNRAVAMAMHESPAVGLELVDAIQVATHQDSARRPRRLSSGALGPCPALPPPGPHRRGPRCLPARWRWPARSWSTARPRPWSSDWPPA